MKLEQSLFSGGSRAVRLALRCTWAWALMTPGCGGEVFLWLRLPSCEGPQVCWSVCPLGAPSLCRRPLAKACRISVLEQREQEPS